MSHAIDRGYDVGVAALCIRNAQPLSKRLHASLGVNFDRRYLGFAGHLIPVILEEVTDMAFHYPVVVANGTSPFLAALVGLQERFCGFIRGASWLPTFKPPVCLRQTPFCVSQSSGAQTDSNILVDVDSPMLDDRFEQKLFDGSGLSSVCTDAVQAAVAYRNGIEKSHLFAFALKQLGLLQPFQADERLRNIEVARDLSFVSPDILSEPGARSALEALPDSLRSVVLACAASMANLEILALQKWYRSEQDHQRSRADL